jgi:formate dehydrogenase subunit gamma
MTATRTSAAPTASEPASVARFGGTERALHWVHAVGFFGMTGTGLVLYLPALASAVGDRPLVKAVHLAFATGWLTAIAAVVAAGDRRALRRTRRDLERFTDDDLRWLRRRPARAGRFNAGQKLHASLQAAFALLFVVSGVLLWLGERDTALRLPGTLAVHDLSALIVAVLVGGHLYLALFNEPTRPALEGMTRGTVPAEWACRHHAAWKPQPWVRWCPPRRALVAAAVVVLAGLAATVVVARDVVPGDASPPAAGEADR